MNALLLAFALVQTAPDCGKHFAAGLQEYQRKDLNKALIAFRAAAQCDPKLAQAYLAIADIYAERGNDGEALAALLQALQIEPKNVLALRAAANLYLKNDEHRKALPLLVTLVTVTPQSAEAHADLAAVYATKGDHKEAEAEFRRALELRADYFPALAGLGNLLSRAGDDKAAAPLLRKAVQLRPQSYEGHFLLGSTLNRLDQFEEARTELEQASKLGGANDPRVFYQLARAWGGLGKAPERKAALARGTHAHRLLQALPNVPTDARIEAARRYLARAQDLAAQESEGIIEQVQRLLDDARFAELFQPGSRLSWSRTLHTCPVCCFSWTMLCTSRSRAVPPRAQPWAHGCCRYSWGRS